MPGQRIGSADEARAGFVWPAFAGVAPSYACSGGEDDDDSGGGDDDNGGGGDSESRNAACTHKSSAHIRLKTPQFLLETSPPIWHSHSRSDPSPVDVRPAAADDALYSRVDKSRKRRLKSFAGSDGSDSESVGEVEGEGCGLVTSSSRHYEEINVTSRPDADGVRVPPSAQQTLRNLVRRNFPKVLPDLARVQQKRVYRLSLPAVGAAKVADGCAECYANVSGGRSGRLPPAPPPRITSTLGRRPTPHPAETAAAANNGGDDTQLSRIIVRLKKSDQPRAAEETGPDIVQTESCCPPRPPPLPLGAVFTARTVAPSNAAAAASAAVEESWRKTTKEVRSVTTSTTGIS